MKISSNITAMMTVANMNKANNSAGTAMQRLSSGLKINSAGDDPAGLAIANKLSTQVKGISQANKNVMDGISLVQTAEGALNEVHSMLNRIKELTVQGLNGSLDESDREPIQEEIDELIEEIKTIQKNTEFNQIGLLNSKEDIIIQIGSNSDQAMTIDGKGINLDQTIDLIDGLAFKKEYKNNSAGIKFGGIDITGLGMGNITVTGADSKLKTDKVSGNIKLTGVDATTDLSTISEKDMISGTIEIEDKNGEKIKVTGTFEIISKGTEATGKQTIEVSFTGTVEDSGKDSDKDMLTRIDAAINMTSNIRGKLGACQNRLEHTTSNLQVSEENITASLSRIQDADMAEEMTNYTQYNVISQAGIAMLAQANQRPQQVLQLLNS